MTTSKLLFGQEEGGPYKYKVTFKRYDRDLGWVAGDVIVMSNYDLRDNDQVEDVANKVHSVMDRKFGVGRWRHVQTEMIGVDDE